MAERYRKKPVEIEAVRWDGENEMDLIAFVGPERFNALDDEDRQYADDPEWTAQVFDDLHGTWVGVYTGQWIVRGVKGEFYPCADDVFAETYERVEQ